MNDLLDRIASLFNENKNFSDVILKANSKVMVRAPDGWVESNGIQPLSEDQMTKFMEFLAYDWNDLLDDGSFSRPLNIEGWRMRVNAYMTNGGKDRAITLRRIPINPIPIQDLGLPGSVRLMIEPPRGLILISGATGAGKSTTMASLIEEINKTRSSHIITIEDPIEYVFTEKRSIFSQREIGLDTKSLATGLKDALRQRPDVIVVGEIRDAETAETAIHAGESGHLVIGTVHSNSAPGAIQKMFTLSKMERETFIASMGDSLLGVISQILLPAQDGGYALAAELMFNQKQQLSKLIGDNEKLQSAIDRSDDSLSVSFENSLVTLVKLGKVSKQNAIRALHGSAQLYERLKSV
jgi:twitching motility protein PilT